jgi:hypothetical protein
METEKRISAPVVKPSVFILDHATFYCGLPRNTKTKLKRASREAKRPFSLKQCQQFRFIFESHAQ